MRLDELKRNKKKINDAVYFGSLIKATADVDILIPARYQKIGLYSSGITTKTCGIFMIVSGGHYAVSTIAGSLELTPSIIENIMLDDEEYIKLTFFKGDIISKTISAIGESDNLFSILSDFVIGGRVPKFLTIDDLLRSINNIGKYIDKKYNKLNKTFELVISIISRDPLNKNKFSRQTGSTGVSFVGLSNIDYSFADSAKITHNYFRLGLISGMVGEPEKPIYLDTLLQDS